MVIVEKSFPRGGEAKRVEKVPDRFRFGAKSVKVKKVKKPKKKAVEKDSEEKPLVARSAALINRRTVQEGMLIMGFITKIEKTQLTISLPGKLKGLVKVTSISDAYTRAIEKAMETGNGSRIPQLTDMFKLGQSVYSKVMGMPKDGATFFDLSLLPKDIHSDFSHSSLNEGMILNGVVTSWEDHGAVVDLGIANTRCFLKRSLKTAGLLDGQSCCVRIEELTKTSTTANINLALVDEESSREVDLDTVEKLDYLIPTTQVTITVLNTLKNGLAGKILDGMFDAYINEQHLGKGRTLADFKIGQDVVASVLYVMPLTKFVYLTLNTFIPAEARLPDGSIHENVSILAVNTGGVALKLNKNSLGLLSTGRMKTETSLEDLQRKYANQVEKVRVLSYDPMDAVYICTDDAKMMKEKFFHITDVQVGQEVSCKVAEPMKVHGLSVKIGQVNGFIHARHVCKTLLKAKAGASIKARVIFVDEGRKSVHLTTLKQFLKAKENDLIVDRDEIKKGSDYFGLITSVTPKLIFVEFFNKISGALKNVKSSEEYKEGAVVKVTVSKVVGDKIFLDTGSRRTQVVHQVGEMVLGTVKGVHEAGLELEAKLDTGKKVTILVESPLVTEFPELAEPLCSSYKRGDMVTAIVLDNNTYSIRDVAAFQRFPLLKKSELSPGKCIRSIVKKVNEAGLAIFVPTRDGGVQSKIPYAAVLMDSEVEHKQALFSENQVVYAKILGQPAAGKRYNISCRLDQTFTGNGYGTINCLKDYFGELDRIHKLMFEANDFKLKIGDRVEGEVSKVVAAGKEYEVQFGGSFQGKLSTSSKLSKKAAVSCVIVWVDELGTIFLSDDAKVVNTKPNRSQLVFTKQKEKGLIVHKTKYLYVVFSEVSKSYIYVPVRLHHNDFQPSLDNRTGECSVIVLHTKGDKPIALFSELFDQMVALGMKVPEPNGRKRKNTVSESSANGEVEIPEKGSPNKKKLKLSKEALEEESVPMVLDSDAMSSFWKMDFGTIQTKTNDDLVLFEDDEATEEGKRKQPKGPSETDIRNLEEALAASANIPSSTEEFERLVLATPNNSLIWIKFMVFHLQALEVEKARHVFRRALKAINFRWQDDILNVWVAFLNLELRYGSAETFEQGFAEALSCNDQFKITMRTVEILADSEKIALCKAKAQLAMKKFKENAELWPKVGAAYFRLGLNEEANQLVNKALSVLDKRDHLQVIVEFAKLNRTNGQLDTATTLLEQVLISYPKRVDIWSFYVDMLVKESQVESARAILERATSQKLPAKKMKTLFKKYLDFEERFGDENAVEHVKKMASEYVQSQQ